MKSLKFRAWNKNQKKWQYFEPSNFTMYRNEINRHVINGNELYLFTGLKDKNGKDIFEGDLICGIMDGNIRYDIIAEVIYLNGSFVDSYFHRPIYNYSKTIEKVGDKFSNPDLLKTQPINKE